MSRRALAVLPSRDGDPAPPSALSWSDDDSPAEILRCAELLGVPWRRILHGEIEAEQRLRRYLADVDEDCSVPSALTILSFSFLESWRVRDRIQSLALETEEGSGRSSRSFRAAFRRFLGGGGNRDQAALTEHLAFAYQRVLLLQRVCRGAARSRGTTPERIAIVCSRTRCCFEDAAWAVDRESSRDRASRLDAVVRKVRDEGFLIPRSQTEARSLSELRRLARRSPRQARQPLASRSPFAAAVPRRLEPSDTTAPARS